MSADRLPSSIVARVMDEVDRDLSNRLARPVVLIAETDSRIRERAVPGDTCTW
jgi:hypothetical protein